MAQPKTFLSMFLGRLLKADKDLNKGLERIVAQIRAKNAKEWTGVDRKLRKLYYRRATSVHNSSQALCEELGKAPTREFASASRVKNYQRKLAAAVMGKPRVQERNNTSERRRNANRKSRFKKKMLEAEASRLNDVAESLVDLESGNQGTRRKTPRLTVRGSALSNAIEQYNICVSGGIPPPHNVLRFLCQRVYMRNSFLGSTRGVLLKLLKTVLGTDVSEIPPSWCDPLFKVPIPSALETSVLTGEGRRAQRALAESVADATATNVVGLSKLVSDEDFNHFVQHGFVVFRGRLCLDPSEREVFRLETLNILASAGIDVDDPATYCSYEIAEHGIDAGNGWVDESSGRLRPAPNQEPLENAPLASKVCLTLKLQLYNAKLKLPCGKQTSFSHLDANYRRIAATLAKHDGYMAPAVQTIVALSDSIKNGQRLDSIRFQKLVDDERLRSAAGGASPYELRQAGAGSSSQAFGEPSWIEFGGPPVDLRVGDVVMFLQTTCHEIVQNAVALDGVRPADMIRRAEYPMLICPALHGSGWQSTEEVRKCLLEGRGPHRWAHVYTGNCSQLIAAGPSETEVFPPPNTPLSRSLVEGTMATGPFAAVVRAQGSSKETDDALLHAVGRHRHHLEGVKLLVKREHENLHQGTNEK